MRNKFAEIIYKESIKNSKICVVVADISPAGSMDLFEPNILKIRNTGVAEQSMIGIAAGMSKRFKTILLFNCYIFTL